MNVKVVERSQQIKVQAQEIIRKEKELEANVRKPAEAQKYKEEKTAEANKNKIILEAEAEAEAIRVSIINFFSHKHLASLILPSIILPSKKFSTRSYKAKINEI